MDPKKLITVFQDSYDKLVQDSNFLNALISVGVDNWSGYEEAQNIVNEENDSVQS